MRRGIKEGVFTENGSGTAFELSKRGQELTDTFTEHACDNTLAMMGMSMVFKGFEPGWFVDEKVDDIATLAEHMKFDAHTVAKFKRHFAAALEKERPNA
jgi:hypothetical protein